MNRSSGRERIDEAVVSLELDVNMGLQNAFVREATKLVLLPERHGHLSLRPTSLNFECGARRDRHALRRRSGNGRDHRSI